MSKITAEAVTCSNTGIKTKKKILYPLFRLDQVGQMIKTKLA